MTGCCIVSGLAIFIVSFQFVKTVLPWLYKNFIGPKFLGPRVQFDKMGKWALITGATDGIGKAYAKALAKSGLNLVLVSRSATKLESVAKEIGESAGCEVKTVDVDFTKGPEIYEKIAKSIENLDIGVLVNNVGISFDHPEYFLDVPRNDTFMRDIIACNIHSVTHMCQIVLPGMVKRHKGVVINIASLAAVIPNPLLSVYSATKAFVNKFSEDLNTEYKGQGIIVQSVMPGFVVSNMSKIKKPTVMAPSADTYVRSALRTVGIATGTTGYFPHALLKLTLDSLAFVVSESFANNYVLKELLNTRKRALRHKTKTN